MKLRLPRGVASFVVCSISLVFLYFVGLGVYTEAISFVDELPAYGARINELVDDVSMRVERFQESVYRTCLLYTSRCV